MKKNTNITDEITIEPLREQRNVVKEIRTDTVDANGEFLSSVSQKTSKVEAEPPFIKLYIKDLLYLKNLPKGLNVVLLALLRRIDYKNQIVVNVGIKRQISEESGVSVDRISHSITEFIKKKILFRKDTGIYLANPYLFGKGTWADIKNIRLTIEYSLEEVQMFSQIEKEDTNEQLAS